MLTTRLLRPCLHFPLSLSLRLGPKYYSTERTLPSAAYDDPLQANETMLSESPADLTKEQEKMLDIAVRVDQAGEIAANWIYAGQASVLSHDPRAGPLIQEMWEQEKKHLRVMDHLQRQHRIRPTVLTDVAKVAGFGLGAVTALLGKEAAMACTEAVETVIGEHYNDQLKELESLPQHHPSIPQLRAVLEEFRNDELEHLDIAVENHSQRAPAHALLSSIIGIGCKTAIELCKRF